MGDVEPFLLNGAGRTIYQKSMKRITVKAKSIGEELPADFAKAAKTTEKRRMKQDEFIKAKEAERIAAEEEAAAAAAAEAEAAAAAAEEASVEASVEEPEPVEA